MTFTANDPRLKRLLTSTGDLSAAPLATKILINRLRREVQANAGDLSAKMNELREFFTKNQFATRGLF